MSQHKLNHLWTLAGLGYCWRAQWLSLSLSLSLSSAPQYNLQNVLEMLLSSQITLKQWWLQMCEMTAQTLSTQICEDCQHLILTWALLHIIPADICARPCLCLVTSSISLSLSNEHWYLFIIHSKQLQSMEQWSVFLSIHRQSCEGCQKAAIDPPAKILTQKIKFAALPISNIQGFELPRWKNMCWLHEKLLQKRPPEKIWTACCTAAAHPGIHLGMTVRLQSSSLALLFADVVPHFTCFTFPPQLTAFSMTGSAE